MWMDGDTPGECTCSPRRPLAFPHRYVVDGVIEMLDLEVVEWRGPVAGPNGEPPLAVPVHHVSAAAVDLPKKERKSGGAPKKEVLDGAGYSGFKLRMRLDHRHKEALLYDVDGKLVVPPEYDDGSAPAAGGGARASVDPQLTREPPGVWPEVMTS